MAIQRIYHPWNECEEYKSGMWGYPAAEDADALLTRAIAFTGDAELYGEWMLRALDEWPMSCEHNLSCVGMNRQAWIGHAACCLAIGCPEHITRLAWHQLTQEQQDAANLKADIAIALWEENYYKKFQSPTKRYIDKSVFLAARERISWTFDQCKKISVSFSGGKDSTVMLHLVMDEAIKRNRKVGVLFIDLEGQYKLTIDHVYACYDRYKDYIEPYWVCLPIHLRNAVSVYETHWVCWDKEKRDAWIRPLPEMAISDESYFPFFHRGMEFEEFVPEFGEWYSGGENTAIFVGIRTDESLNRFRTIQTLKKQRLAGRPWTTTVSPNTYNIYPIYDWRTEDLWTYHALYPDKGHNKLYDLMHKAGLSIHQMRICQPYGDDQRRGLWLFHLIEPETWARVVARVNGANSGALYVQETGNINGYRRVSKPPQHTWKSFAQLLVSSMPPRTKEHYENKIVMFQKWWMERGYKRGIPDEAPYELEAKRKVPSWRRVVKSLLRNDYWCKGLSFTQHRSAAYGKYLELMKKRKTNYGVENLQLNLLIDKLTGDTNDGFEDNKAGD